MSPDEQSPLFPAAPGSYPKPAEPSALPSPAPLGPTTTPLPRASSVYHVTLTVPATDYAFAIAARAPVGSVITFFSLHPLKTVSLPTLSWAIRGHTSLPTTATQFLSGPLVLPTYIQTDIDPDWAAIAPIYSGLFFPARVRLPQSSPLLVLGGHNSSGTAAYLGLYLVIDPPPAEHP